MAAENAANASRLRAADWFNAMGGGVESGFAGPGALKNFAGLQGQALLDAVKRVNQINAANAAPRNQSIANIYITGNQINGDDDFEEMVRHVISKAQGEGWYGVIPAPA